MFLPLDSLLCTENKSGKETAVDLKAYGIHGDTRTDYYNNVFLMNPK